MRRLTINPYVVAAGDLAPMDTKQLAERDESGRRLLVFADEHRPLGRIDDFARSDRPAAVERSQVAQRADGAHGDFSRLAADAKARDRAGGQRIGKWLGFGVDDVHGGATQA